MLFSTLLLALVIGASLRSVEIKENFAINNGFEYWVNMASHFWTDPGGYNFEEGLKMKENPEDYVFSRHPEGHATGSFENEKGWAFVMSLILPEGAKGISNLAKIVAHYQIALEMLVIILMFWAGKGMCGPWGGATAAMLYALFKPSISMAAWVSYYYWVIPFSALSLFFWTTIYRPERKYNSISHASVLFFLYGTLMGLAAFFRLSFLFLPWMVAPLIFLRERAFKKNMILLLFLLLGQGIALFPQVLITNTWFGKKTLSTRGVWHTVISGLGASPNPFGIKDSADLTAVEWAKSHGGPDLNKVGIEEYDRFMKKKAIALFKERPDIFIRNFRNNLLTGITMTYRGAVRYYGGPRFIGLIDSDTITYGQKILCFAYIFPFVLLLALILAFFFYWEQFWLLILVFIQGLYIIGILGFYFIPVDAHQVAYFPVYVLLWAVSLVLIFKTFAKILKIYPKAPNSIRLHEPLPEPPMNSNTGNQIGTEPGPKVKRTLAIAGVGLVAIFWLGTEWTNNVTDPRPESVVAPTINGILTPDTNGNFELWSRGETNPPDEWGFTRLDGDGNSGGSRRVGEVGNVKFGEWSVELRGNNSGDSNLHFSITSDKLYPMLGKTIKVEAWVKSENTTPNQVALALSDRLDYANIPQTYYQNTGKWEKLTITYTVPPGISSLMVVCKLGKNADSTAVFDGVSIKLVPQN